LKGISCANCPKAHSLRCKVVESKALEDKYAEVKEFEKKSEQEKKDFWDMQLSKYIKCYACREEVSYYCSLQG